MKKEKLKARNIKVRMKFTWLTVIGGPISQIAECNRKYKYWKCRCKCGKELWVKGSDLIRKQVQSCGCYSRYRSSIENKKHGMWNHRLYKIYQGMKTRCYNPNGEAYSLYGGRGITVCDEWLGDNGFIAFKDWAYANGYYDQPENTPRKDRLTIDRVDNDGPYAPWNCRWVTAFNQNNNRSTSHYIYDGEEVLTRSNFERKYGWKRATVNNMVRYWDNTDAIVYAAHHPELKLRKKQNKDGLYTEDGFRILIPKIGTDLFNVEFKSRVKR